eukprot:2981219-Pyramimonas_sp.AAC.1
MGMIALTTFKGAGATYYGVVGTGSQLDYILVPKFMLTATRTAGPPRRLARELQVTLSKRASSYILLGKKVLGHLLSIQVRSLAFTTAPNKYNSCYDADVSCDATSPTPIPNRR